MEALYPPDQHWQDIIELTHRIIAWMDADSEDGEQLQAMLDQRQQLIENYFHGIDESTRRASDIEYKIKEQLRLDAQIICSAKAQQADILAKNASMRDQRAGLKLYALHK